MKKLMRDPLSAFVVLGVLVFGYFYACQDAEKVPVELSAANKKAFVEDFESLTGRKATPEDVRKIEDDYIDEEILFREALDNGFHMVDPKIRSQLVELMRYQISGARVEPDESQLVQYYLKHIDRYYQEPTLSVRHVFFENKPEQVEQQLSALNAGKEVKGDEFWRGRELPHYGISMLRGMFGQEFLAKLQQAPNEQWVGPFQSLMGWHYVYIYGRTEKFPLTFTQAKMQVANDFTKDQVVGEVRDYISSLGDKYEVIRHE